MWKCPKCGLPAVAIDKRTGLATCKNGHVWEIEGLEE